jgi:hypothetical protein
MKNYETILSSTIRSQKLDLLHSCSSREPSTSQEWIFSNFPSLTHERTFPFLLEAGI